MLAQMRDPLVLLTPCEPLRRLRIAPNARPIDDDDSGGEKKKESKGNSGKAKRKGKAKKRANRKKTGAAEDGGSDDFASTCIEVAGISGHRNYLNGKYAFKEMQNGRPVYQLKTTRPSPGSGLFGSGSGSGDEVTATVHHIGSTGGTFGGSQHWAISALSPNQPNSGGGFGQSSQIYGEKVYYSTSQMHGKPNAVVSSGWQPMGNRGDSPPSVVKEISTADGKDDKAAVAKPLFKVGEKVTMIDDAVEYKRLCDIRFGTTKSEIKPKIFAASPSSKTASKQLGKFQTRSDLCGRSGVVKEVLVKGAGFQFGVVAERVDVKDKDLEICVVVDFGKGYVIQCPESACYPATKAAVVGKGGANADDARGGSSVVKPPTVVDVGALFAASDGSDAADDAVDGSNGGGGSSIRSSGIISGVHAALEAKSKISPQVLLRLVELGGPEVLQAQAPGKGWTALHCALDAGTNLSDEILKQILDVGGASLLARGSFAGHSVLHSIMLGDLTVPLPVCRMLLSRGNDELPLARDACGRSPVHAYLESPPAAASADVTALVMDLLARGGSTLVEQTDDNGNTPLHSALRTANLIPEKVIQYLVEFEGGRLLSLPGCDQRTPFHTALACAKVLPDALLYGILETCAAAGTLAAKDAHGDTSLTIALQNVTDVPEEVLLRLLELGGDPLVEESKGQFTIEVARTLAPDVPPSIVEIVTELDGGAALLGVGWASTDMGKACCRKLRYFVGAVKNHFSAPQVAKVLDSHIGPARAVGLLQRLTGTGRFRVPGSGLDLDLGTNFIRNPFPSPAPPDWHTTAAGKALVVHFQSMCRLMSELGDDAFEAVLEGYFLPFELAQMFASIGRTGHTYPGQAAEPFTVALPGKDGARCTF